jgi:hypothetical protein
MVQFQHAHKDFTILVKRPDFPVGVVHPQTVSVGHGDRIRHRVCELPIVAPLAGEHEVAIVAFAFRSICLWNEMIYGPDIRTCPFLPFQTVGTAKLKLVFEPRAVLPIV